MENILLKEEKKRKEKGSFLFILLGQREGEGETKEGCEKKGRDRVLCSFVSIYLTFSSLLSLIYSLLSISLPPLSVISSSSSSSREFFFFHQPKTRHLQLMMMLISFHFVVPYFYCSCDDTIQEKSSSYIWIVFEVMTLYFKNYWEPLPYNRSIQQNSQNSETQVFHTCKDISLDG